MVTWQVTADGSRPAHSVPLRTPHCIISGDCDGAQASAVPSARTSTVAFMGSMQAWVTKGTS